MTDTAIIYRTHFDAIENLPEEQQLSALKALIKYCMDDEVPENGVASCVLMMAKPVLDKWKSRCEAGKKGGKANSKQTESNCEATVSKPEANVSNSEPKIKVKVKEKEKSILTDTPKESADPLMVSAKKIVDHLNEKAGTHYRSHSKATVELIKARLNEKWTVEDFFTVIDNKTAEWLGTEQEQYLRPETLFARSHFESYLNQKPRPSERPKSPNKFCDFEQRNDSDHKSLVQQLIDQQLGA